MRDFRFKETALAVFLSAVVFFACALAYAQDKTPAAKEAAVADYQPPQPFQAGESAATFFATLFKFGFSLVVIIVLVYVTIYVLKVVTSGYKPSGVLGKRVFEILDSLNIGPNKSIHLVSVDNKRLLVISVSEKEVNLLDKIEDAAYVKEITSKIEEKWNSTHTFREHFRAAQKKKLIQEQIKGYLSNVTGFFQNLKKR